MGLLGKRIIAVREIIKKFLKKRDISPFSVLIDRDLYQLIFKIMTAKKKTRKLEFRKETIIKSYESL